MSKQKLTQDEALALRLRDKLGIKSPSGSDKPSSELVEIAEWLRTQVIDPAVIAGSLKLLEADRDALYASVPEGDIDAWGLLQIIQNHLQNLDTSIASLKAVLQPNEVDHEKPLSRMDKAQEGEIVDHEDEEA